MSDQKNLQDRLSFVKLDETSKQALSQAQGAIERALPASLDEFYDQIRRHPQVSRFFNGESHISGAKNSQSRHWANIASGRFDQSYLDSVQRIGSTHARIGLEPRWYIGGYAMVLDGLVKGIVADHEANRSRWAKGDKGLALGATVGAVVKAALLDMDFVISIYLEAEQQARAEAEAASQAAQDENRRTMEMMQGLLAAVDQSQATIEFDMDGVITTANDTFLRAMGYGIDEIVGQHHRMFVDQEDARSEEYRAFWKQLRLGRPRTEKFTRYGKGGRKVILLATYSPVMGADGLPVKVIKLATDITVMEEERERGALEQAMVVRETAQALSSVADGDLTARISAAFNGEYEQLKDDFNNAMQRLESALSEIASNTAAMKSGAGEISQAADDLSRRTEQQAATLEETAAALDEITATVRRTAEGAQRAGVVVGSAREDAERSGEVVSKAVEAMGDIERSADQISQIIGVIDEIAFQTNLLALNAGVEAARAGDAGKGFAVVASEVRALAQRSAEAAKEIKSLISASTNQVKTGVSLVGQTGEALTAIVGRVAEINGLMSEISASAVEQATALGEVNTAVNQMDQTTQQNAAMVEQSTAASHSLTQETEQLARLVGRFKVSDQGDSGALRRPTSRAAEPRGASSIRESQSRIADFARRHSAPARTQGALALKPSTEAEWEEF
ncbi:MAG: methyl-accepting chemotaxis protein [bacterium]|nr:MAG: methyl-accepting chemotaxis protein [bacterium]